MKNIENFIGQLISPKYGLNDIKALLIRYLFCIPILVSCQLYPEARIESITHPNAHIALITVTTEDEDRLKFNGMSKSSLQKYAHKWGYDLHHYSGSLDNKRSPKWSKILALQKHVLSEQYDWIVWIDDDMIITNPEVRIEEFIEKYGADKNFIAQDNHHYRKDLRGPALNSGVFLLRTGEWAHDFLQYAYNLGQKQGRQWAADGNNDQQSFQLMTQITPYQEKMVVINTKELQGYDNPEWRWEMPGHLKMIHLKWAPGDFIMHASGQDGTRRQERFAEVIKELNL